MITFTTIYSRGDGCMKRIRKVIRRVQGAKEKTAEGYVIFTFKLSIIALIISLIFGETGSNFGDMLAILFSILAAVLLAVVEIIVLTMQEDKFS